jgi:F0F1-type ATP synthase assembly protein I
LRFAGTATRARSHRGREPGVTKIDPKKVTSWRQIGLLSSIPFILALAPIVGYFLGKFLDQKFRTQPWLSIILLVLGFVAGVNETIKIVKMSQRED